MLSLTTVLLVSVNSTILAPGGVQPVDIGPPCKAPPQNASEAVEDCYEQACKVFKAAWAECADEECRILADYEYGLNIGKCELARVIQFIPAGRESWVTLSYANGEWSYTFDGTSPLQATIYKF